VLINLLLSTLKFINEVGVDIKIYNLQSQIEIEVDIKNRGQGIPKVLVDNLMNPSNMNQWTG
jgi:phosphoglycerate-specific signal transduction histidine kinase